MPGAGVEPTLEYQRRRDLVYHLPAAGPPSATGDQRPLGEGGGEALVPALDGEAAAPGEGTGQAIDATGHRPGASVGLQRPPDHDVADLVLVDQRGDRLEIGLEPRAADGGDALRDDAQAVADRDPDGAGADVQGQRAADQP